MATTVLTNTSSQIDCTIKESYSRITGGYAAPTGISYVESSGFLIKTADQTSGIMVANAYTDFYNNIIRFKGGDPVCICGINDRLLFTSDGYFYEFNPGNTLSIGAENDASTVGLQIHNTNPSLVLNHNGDSDAYYQCLAFKNNSVYKFSIAQVNNNNIYIDNPNAGIYLSTNSINCSLSVLGDKVAVNSNVSNYNFSVSGNSLFTNTINLQSGIISSGQVCISDSIGRTGFDVNTRSIFRNNICVSGNFSGINLSITGNLCAPTGYITNISGSGCSVYTSGVYNNLIISGGSDSYFNIDTNFYKTSYFNNICSTGTACISGGISGINLIITGQLSHCGGQFEIKPRSAVTHTLSGNCFVFQTSAGSAGINGSCDFIIQGNLVNTGYASKIAAPAYFNSICTVADSNNAISGCLFIQCCIRSPIVCGANYISSVSGNFTNCVFAVSAVCSQACVYAGTYICAAGTLNTNCLCCSLEIKGNVTATGYISSINTAKAWGVYSLKCGVPTIITGYNVCNYMTIPITGIRITGGSPSPGGDALYHGSTGSGTIASKFVWSSPFVFYGIRLCNTVKWPFTFDINFSPVGVLDSNVYGAGGLATGTGSFGLYSNSSGVYGLTGNQLSQPLISTLVNCAGKNINGNYLTGDFERMQFGSSYNEVVFNISPIMTNTANYYSVLSNSNLNGTGSFVIYSY